MTRRLTSKAARGSHKKRAKGNWSCTGDENYYRPLPARLWLCLPLSCPATSLHFPLPSRFDPAMLAMRVLFRVVWPSRLTSWQPLHWAIIPVQHCSAPLCSALSILYPALCLLRCHVTSLTAPEQNEAIGMCVANLVISSNLDYLEFTAISQGVP